MEISHWLRLLIHKDRHFFGSGGLRNVYFKKSYRAVAGMTFYSVETSTLPAAFCTQNLKCCVAFNLLGNKNINIAFLEEVRAVCFMFQYYHNVPI